MVYEGGIRDIRMRGLGSYGRGFPESRGGVNRETE